MIIKSKELIPAVYSESYDMSIFTGLLDMIYTGRQLDDLRAKVSHCPQHCFKEDITHLASLFGFGEEATREVLENYRSLVKIKGTEQAIMSLISYAYGCVWPDRQAVKFVNLVDPKTLKDVTYVAASTYDLLQYNYDAETKRSTITAYIDIKDERQTLFLELVKRLAPVGAFIQVRPLAEKN